MEEPIPAFDAMPDVPGVPVELADRLALEVAQSLVFLPHETEDDRLARVNAAVASVKAFEPQDAMEAHLIVQMVCAHQMAAECTRLATRSGQSLEQIGMALKHVARFMELFQLQLKTLNKLRGPNFKLSHSQADYPRHIEVTFVKGDGTTWIEGENGEPGYWGLCEGVSEPAIEAWHRNHPTGRVLPGERTDQRRDDYD